MKKYVFIFTVLLTSIFPISRSNSGSFSNNRMLDTFNIVEDYRKAKEIELFKVKISEYVNYTSTITKLNSDSIDYNRFKDVMSMRESSDNYKAINSYGYMGKYQFGKKTLRTLRELKLLKFKDIEINKSKFFENKLLQEAAMLSLTSHNYDIFLNKDSFKFVGSNINGVVITKEGMLAAAHLRGNYAVRLFLHSNGKINKVDANNTSVKDYLKLFS